MSSDGFGSMLYVRVIASDLSHIHMVSKVHIYLACLDLITSNRKRERVYNKSFKDIKNFDTITSLKFSPDGKLISASSCSIQIVIDIESGIVCDHHVDCSTADSTKDLSHAEWIVETKLGWNQRDLCLVDDLLNDDRIDETIDALSRQINFLFSRYECNKTLRFYQSGIRPILQLQLDRVNKFISQNQKGDNILGFCKSSEHDFIVDVIICNFNEKFASAWKMSKLISSIQSSLKSIDETTTSLNKRWKESTRVLPAKLLLLKALLHGYQYEGDVFDFFASVCLCGLWHPAAQATFSQHWNEQGLARLRSSLDSTTKYIIRTIQFKLLPFAINITNQLR